MNARITVGDCVFVGQRFSSVVSQPQWVESQDYWRCFCLQLRLVQRRLEKKSSCMLLQSDAYFASGWRKSGFYFLYSLSLFLWVSYWVLNWLELVFCLIRSVVVSVILRKVCSVCNSALCHFTHSIWAIISNHYHVHFWHFLNVLNIYCIHPNCSMLLNTILNCNNEPQKSQWTGKLLMLFEDEFKISAFQGNLILHHIFMITVLTASVETWHYSASQKTHLLVSIKILFIVI